MFSLAYGCRFHVPNQHSLVGTWRYRQAILQRQRTSRISYILDLIVTFCYCGEYSSLFQSFLLGGNGALRGRSLRHWKKCFAYGFSPDTNNQRVKWSKQEEVQMCACSPDSNERSVPTETCVRRGIPQLTWWLKLRRDFSRAILRRCRRLVFDSGLLPLETQRNCAFFISWFRWWTITPATIPLFGVPWCSVCCSLPMELDGARSQSFREFFLAPLSFLHPALMDQADQCSKQIGRCRFSPKHVSRSLRTSPLEGFFSLKGSLFFVNIFWVHLNKSPNLPTRAQTLRSQKYIFEIFL